MEKIFPTPMFGENNKNFRGARFCIFKMNLSEHNKTCGGTKKWGECPRMPSVATSLVIRTNSLDEEIQVWIGKAVVVFSQLR